MIKYVVSHYAPRPNFVTDDWLQTKLEDETISQVRSDITRDEWVIGCITDILYDRVDEENSEVLERCFTEKGQ